MSGKGGIGVFACSLGFFNIHEILIFLIEEDFLKFWFSLDEKLNHDALNKREDPRDLLVEGEIELVAPLGDDEKLLILEGDKGVEGFVVGERRVWGGWGGGYLTDLGEVGVHGGDFGGIDVLSL